MGVKEVIEIQRNGTTRKRNVEVLKYLFPTIRVKSCEVTLYASSVQRSAPLSKSGKTRLPGGMKFLRKIEETEVLLLECLRAARYVSMYCSPAVQSSPRSLRQHQSCM